MCNYIVTEWACGCFTSLHEACEMRKDVEYPHFLRCTLVEESRLSEKTCKKCRWMKAAVDFATPSPTRETKSHFLGGTHRWNMLNLISRKTSFGKVKGKSKIDSIEVPNFRRRMFAPPTPKEHVVQPTSPNRVVVHPLRLNPMERPQKTNKIPRKPVIAATTKSQEDEPCFDDRPLTATTAEKIAVDTKRIPIYQFSGHLKYHDAISAPQNAEPSVDKPSTAKSTAKADVGTKHSLSHKPSIHSQYRGSAAAIQKAELLFDHRPSSENAERKAKNDIETILNSRSKLKTPRTSPPIQLRPVTLTALIPELQSYATYRPPIDVDKLAGYLTEVATRPRPHKPLSAEDEEILAQQSQMYTAVRHATATALQNAEIMPHFDRLGEEIPSRSAFVVPERHTVVLKTPRLEALEEPQTMKRGKSFEAMNFGEVPSYFDFRGELKQDTGVEKSAAGVISKEVETPHTLETCPAITQPRVAGCSTPHQTFSPTTPAIETVTSHTVTPNPHLTKVQAPTCNRVDPSAIPGWETFISFSPDYPHSPGPLKIQKKMSPQGALNANASALVPRAAPRIPSLQKISPLKFDGTLFEGFEGAKKPMKVERARRGERYVLNLHEQL